MTFPQEPSDSEVDDEMGNKQSKKPTPSVYYAPGYGVALGDRSPSLDLDSSPCAEDADLEEEARLHPHAQRLNHLRQKSPSPASDKDSAIGGVAGSEMSQSVYSENSALRDSFYSTCTAESGFEELAGYFEQRKVNGHVIENFNPHSLRERNMNLLYRAHRTQDPGLNNLTCSAAPGLDTLSDASSERSGIVSGHSLRGSHSNISEAGSQIRTNVDPLMEKIHSSWSSLGPQAARRHNRSATNSSSSAFSPQHSQGTAATSKTSRTSTGPSAGQFSDPSVVSSPYCSPRHRSSSRSTPSQPHLSPAHRPRVLGADRTDCIHDAPESVQSFNSSLDDIDWDIKWDGDVVEGIDRVLGAQEEPEQVDPEQSLSDLQFQQSLMQRIHEWSAFAEEYNKSCVPEPEFSSPRFIRRSRSLDRHIGDTSQVLIGATPQVLLDASSPDISESKPVVEVVKPVTEKNLETLEYELQDIQGEFESITSKLHDLIERGNINSPSQPKSSKSSPLHRPSANTHLSPKPSPKHRMPSKTTPSSRQQKTQSCPLDSPSVLRRMRTQWGRVAGGRASSICSDSSRSSREGSVDYAWDFADYATNTGDRSNHSRLEHSSLDADCVFKNGKEMFVIVTEYWNFGLDYSNPVFLFHAYSMHTNTL